MIEKLAFLEKEVAITSSPSLKFSLKKQIIECQDKIKELDNNTALVQNSEEIAETSKLNVPSLSSNSVKEINNIRFSPQIGSFNFEIITVDCFGKENHRKLGQAKYFTENLINNVLLDMVFIPSGTFIMGASEQENFSIDNQRPQHQVNVSSLFISKYPITQLQWIAVASLPKIEIELLPTPSRFRGDSRPVEGINWYEANEFCARLSQFTGKLYRLPSESEWEYVCRAGTTTPFHFGETITTDLVNYNGTKTYSKEREGIYRAESTIVGIFPPNAFGIYDLHGNVWEWCQDNWHENYEGSPTDGSVWLALNSETSPLRGGSWFNQPFFCTSSYRYFSYRDGSNFRNLVGLRVVCESSELL